MIKAEESFEEYEFKQGSYYLYVPPNNRPHEKSPLMVVLHGCTQNPFTIATATEMNDTARQNNFLVLYPDQPRSEDSGKCWGWHDADHQERGKGEPRKIVSMINHVKEKYEISDIYITGLSAGAAMALIVGGVYPDLFSGIGVVGGLPYKAAQTKSERALAMINGPQHDAEKMGELLYEKTAVYNKRVPLIVFHGTYDRVVHPINANKLIKQWITLCNLMNKNGKDGIIPSTPLRTDKRAVPVGKTYKIEEYESPDKSIKIHYVTINSMLHSWPGGSVKGTFTDPLAPSASEMMWNFFNQQ
jgi:poly(hydroxyalkanoate) depolymerase family esterase